MASVTMLSLAFTVFVSRLMCDSNHIWNAASILDGQPSQQLHKNKWNQSQSTWTDSYSVITHHSADAHKLYPNNAVHFVNPCHANQCIPFEYWHCTVQNYTSDLNTTHSLQYNSTQIIHASSLLHSETESVTLTHSESIFSPSQTQSKRDSLIPTEIRTPKYVSQISMRKFALNKKNQFETEKIIPKKTDLFLGAIHGCHSHSNFCLFCTAHSNGLRHISWAMK